MANPLLNKLREKDKKGLFTATQTSVSYKTGFLPLDYRNGYIVQVRDLEEKVVDSYESLGIVGGSFVTIVGKSGTAKTTFAIQAAAQIVAPFESGIVEHYDLEQALTYTRIKNVTNMSQRDLDDKYILKQEKSYIEDIYDSIEAIATAKEEFPKEFRYKTGLMDEFNRPIEAYVPTVVIIDSIPTLSSKDAKQEMEGSTYANRVAKAIAQFYKKLMPVIKKYNITVMAINHINTKIEINPFAKTQAQVLYLKMDESLPGGNAPVYYAHNIFKFVSYGKSCKEDDGFDGFKIRCELIKSRTNKAGQSANLVYNQVSGFDPVLTLYEMANDNKLIDGRNPYKYFKNFKDTKFDSRKFRKSFTEDEDLRKALMDTVQPILEQSLSLIDPDEDQYINMLDMYENLLTI